MIGKQVLWSELQKALDREREAVNFWKQLEEELKNIGKGECLRYECKEGGSIISQMVLKYQIGKLKGLKLVIEGNYAYVYRE